MNNLQLPQQYVLISQTCVECKDPGIDTRAQKQAKQILGVPNQKRDSTGRGISKGKKARQILWDARYVDR